MIKGRSHGLFQKDINPLGEELFTKRIMGFIWSHNNNSIEAKFVDQRLRIVMNLNRFALYRLQNNVVNITCNDTVNNIWHVLQSHEVFHTPSTTTDNTHSLPHK